MPSPVLLDDVSPVILPNRSELNLDRVTVPLHYQVERPIAALLRCCDVVTLADDHPRLQQAASDYVDVPLCRQDGPNTANVVHLCDAALLSRELANHRRQTLQALRDLDSALHTGVGLIDVIAKIRCHSRERLGVPATPPCQRLPRTLKLVFVRVHHCAFCTVVLHAFAKVQQQLPGTVDLPLREPGSCFRRGTTGSHVPVLPRGRSSGPVAGTNARHSLLAGHRISGLKPRRPLPRAHRAHALREPGGYCGPNGTGVSCPVGIASS
jgi:hypothetical protein